MQIHLKVSSAALFLTGLLRICFYLWALGFVGLVFSLLLSKDFSIFVTLPLELKPETYQINLPGLHQTGLYVDEVQAKVKLEGEARQLVAWTHLPGMLVAAALGWILYALWKVFDSIARGQPFIQPNVVRLRSIGWLMLAFFLLKGAEGFYHNWLAKQFTAEGVVSVSVKEGWSVMVDPLNPLGSNGVLLVTGLAVLALAEVFQFANSLIKERDSLRKDQELTV